MYTHIYTYSASPHPGVLGRNDIGALLVSTILMMVEILRLTYMYNPDDMIGYSCSWSVATTLKTRRPALPCLIAEQRLTTMPPKQPAPTKFPSYEEARRVFTGNRGGKGNLAAAGTVSTTARNAPRADLANAWIRPQVLRQLKSASDCKFP